MVNESSLHHRYCEGQRATRGLQSGFSSQLCILILTATPKIEYSFDLFPSSCENLSPCCIYFERTSSANTEAVLLWLMSDGCFLSPYEDISRALIPPAPAALTPVSCRWQRRDLRPSLASDITCTNCLLNSAWDSTQCQPSASLPRCGWFWSGMPGL